MARLFISLLLTLAVAVPVLSSQRLRVKPRGVAGGACAVGTTPCVDNISSSAPANGASQTINGQNFVKLTQTGWAPELTTTMSAVDGTHGANGTTLGWTALYDPYGTLSTSVKLRGTGSVFFRSSCTAPCNTPPPPTSSEDSFYVVTGADINEFWASFYFRIASGAIWPDNVIKTFLFAPNSAGAILQPQNGIASGGNETWQCFSGGSGNTPFTLSPDGGVPLEDVWYHVGMHVKGTSPTNCRVYVNGILRTDQTIQTFTTPVNAFFDWGIINGGSASRTYDLSIYMDDLVWSVTQEIPPSNQTWLCPASSDDTIAEMRTNCVWLVPTSISDTQWVGTHRTTGNGVTITAGTRYYVIFNNGLLTGNFPVTVS